MARDLAEVVDFGRYEPLFRIGLGGMAEVYAARIRGEAGFEKLVAVKRMLPHLTGDQKFVDMFLDEARLAANISSPHVVQTLDLGRADDDSLYIVMNLVLGVTISEILRYLATQKVFVDTGIAIELITQAAQGLDDAHEAVAPSGEPLSLVHRDISPQNILVGVDGRARVTDFGIAHALLLRRTETQVGELKGKFAYFSPEQALGKPLDRRSDIFALGIVAWELFTGRRLFKGTPLQQLELVKRCEIRAPATLRPELPQAISDAIMGALARDPNDRHASAAAFASALRRATGSFEEIPGPRSIGRFAKEVGGDRIERIRQCIANSGRLPSDVKTVTGIIEGTVSGTLFLVDDDGSGGSEEGTHILDGELSEVSAAATSQGLATPSRSRDSASAIQEKTRENSRENTREEGLRGSDSKVTTHQHGHGSAPGAGAGSGPGSPLGEQPTLTLPSDGAPTEASGAPGLRDYADLHQAPTEQWILSAEAAPGRADRPRALMPIAAAALALLVVSGGALIFVLSGGSDVDADNPAEPAEVGTEATPAGPGPLEPPSAPSPEATPPAGNGQAPTNGTEPPSTAEVEEGVPAEAATVDEGEGPTEDARAEVASMRRAPRPGRTMAASSRSETTMTREPTTTTSPANGMRNSPIPGWRP